MGLAEIMSEARSVGRNETRQRTMQASLFSDSVQSFVSGLRLKFGRSFKHCAAGIRSRRTIFRKSDAGPSVIKSLAFFWNAQLWVLSEFPKNYSLEMTHWVECSRSLRRKLSEQARGSEMVGKQCSQSHRAPLVASSE